MSSTISIKAKHNKHLRRVRVETSTTLQDLLVTLSALFHSNFSLETHIVRYIDDEDDEITIGEEEEWKEAVRVVSNLPCMKLFIVNNKSTTPKRKTSTATLDGVTNTLSAYISLVGDEVEAIVKPLTEATVECSLSSPEQVLVYCGSPKTTPQQQEQPIVAESVKPVPSHMEQSWTFVEVNNNNNQKISECNSTFVRDLTVPDRTRVQPGSVLTKSWLIKNSGSTAWPQGVKLGYISGPQDVVLSSSVPVANAGQEVTVSATIKVPTQPGIHKGYFKLMTVNGESFGHTFWYEIEVVSPPKQPQPQVVTPIVQPVKVQPAKWDAQLRMLADMGFSNKEALIPLLEKHNGDLTAVVLSYVSL